MLSRLGMAPPLQRPVRYTPALQMGADDTTVGIGPKSGARSGKDVAEYLVEERVREEALPVRPPARATAPRPCLRGSIRRNVAFASLSIASVNGERKSLSM
jgi:hypothetical protein